MQTMSVAAVVLQHVEEVVLLRNLRTTLVRGPHVKLGHLQRLDARLAAHLDGVAVAGKLGSRLCDEVLKAVDRGTVFAATVRALEEGDTQRLDAIFALTEASPGSHPGLFSAFGWVSAMHLREPGRELLAGSGTLRHEVGMSLYGMHKINPAPILKAGFAEVACRARHLRIAGECGRREVLATCLDAVLSDEPIIRFWAARSALLLGDRQLGMQTMESFAMSSPPFRDRALRIMLKVANARHCNRLMQSFPQDPATVRTLMHAIGFTGDPHYVPWLIDQMSDPKLARLAGESFTFITGLDLAYLDLDRKPPEDIEFGPSDDPNDDNVDMDPDENLPWPDPEKIQKWWMAHRHEFQPGTRYFMGKPPSWEHCVDVLKNGYQRQRIAAAEYLCLLRPGTWLFNTSAPALRQARWLSQLH
jgi:uncharacterized protein (TIGR02270 family)